MIRLGAIDCGTNSIRLLIADALDGQLRDVHREMRIVRLGENVDRVGSDPERFYLPAYIGARGWFGLRLDRGRINWTEVGNLLELSYCLTAPKRLAQRFEEQRRR